MMRRVVRILAVLLLAGVLVLGWYAYQRGFTKKWRAFVTKEFRARGVEVSLRQLALVPFRGLVARDVKLYDARDRRRTLVVVDEILLVINYANLFKGQSFIEALDLHRARLVLPIDPKNPRGAAVEINQLSGRLLLPPRQIYLSRLDAKLYGIEVSVAGRLIHPEGFDLKGRGGIQELVGFGERLVGDLKAFKYEAEPPRLDVRFSGDLAEPEKIVVDATFTGRKLQRGAYQLKDLRMEGGLREGAVELRQLEVSDERGTLRASGRWNVASGAATMRVKSSLDLQALAHAFKVDSALEECALYSAPMIELQGQAQMGEKPSLRLTGHLALQRFAYRSSLFDGLNADFSWFDGSWSVRDLQLLHRSGKLTADAIQVPEDFRLQLKSSLNPWVVAPLLPVRFAERFKKFNLEDASGFEIQARGPHPDSKDVQWHVQLIAPTAGSQSVSSPSASDS